MVIYPPQPPPPPSPPLSSSLPAASCSGLVGAGAGCCRDPGLAGSCGQSPGASGTLLKALARKPAPYLFYWLASCVCSGLSSEAGERMQPGSEITCVTHRLSGGPLVNVSRLFSARHFVTALLPSWTCLICEIRRIKQPHHILC